MQIRHKINLWITSLGLLINLVLASIILFEAVELAYQTLDEELEIAIREDLKPLEDIQGKSFDSQLFGEMFDFDEQYWIKVFDINKKKLFASTLAKHIDIPFKQTEDGYNYDTILPANSPFFKGEKAEFDRFSENDGDGAGGRRKITLTFRVNQFKINMGEAVFWVQIARSVEVLDDEIDELISIVVMGFSVAAVILLVLSNFLTHKILQPIVEINALAKAISASDMTQRIPLGKSVDELYHLAKSLNSMFDRLQQSFATQKQLVADAAHELKSPITMLLLFMERSMERQDLPLDYSNQLINQANTLRRMGRLVKNLLDISTLDEKASLHLESFDLGSVVAKILDDFEALFENGGIRVENTIPSTCKVVGDREKIQRLLINLVDNAVKYNWQRGEIRVGFVEKSKEIHIFVWNTGVGIPGNELKQVLKKFYRVEKSRSQKYGGSGLGLTIVDKIARLHGGGVIMESEPGKWCRATVFFPSEPMENIKKTASFICPQKYFTFF